MANGSQKADSKRSFQFTIGPGYIPPSLPDEVRPNHRKDNAGPEPVRLLLTAREAADALHVCERTLWGLTAPRGPIAVVKIGRSVRYDVRDLEQWIEANKQTWT